MVDAAHFDMQAELIPVNGLIGIKMAAPCHGLDNRGNRHGLGLEDERQSKAAALAHDHSHPSLAVLIFGRTPVTGMLFIV